MSLGNHAFGVDPAGGDSYVADEIEVAGKHYFRIQELGAKGEFVAERRVEMAREAFFLEGVAVDGAKERVYLLVVTTREGDHEEILEKISEDEEKLEPKRESLEHKREKSEPTEPLEKEIKTLEGKIKKLEEEALVFDPEAPVAVGLYAFSTTTLEPAPGTPTTGRETGLLAGEKAFSPLSEEAGVPLLDPHGIAVDPVTHDVLILGQQDESKKKGEEELRAAVQRVHTEGAAEGELGPRYVDSENCLDEGATIASEPACAEGSAQPTSPFVSPGGRVYGMRAGELWEIPASEGAAEAFASRPKAYEAKPKRLFTIGRGQGIAGEEGIVEPLVESEQGGALAFVPTGPASGRIYLDAEITAEEGGGTVSKNKGAAVLGYDEDGGTPSARELGWTAGQNGTSEDEKCLLPLGNGQLLLGADGTGRLLLFDVTSSPRHRERAPVRGGRGRMRARAGDAAQCVRLRRTGHQAAEGQDRVAVAERVRRRRPERRMAVRGQRQRGGRRTARRRKLPFPTQVPTLTHEFKHGGTTKSSRSWNLTTLAPRSKCTRM